MLDKVRFRQIILNLVGNAVKFTSQGFIRVSVKGGVVSAGAECHARSDLVLEVEDSGIGIPEDQLPLIFKNFCQQGEQSTRQYGGAGMGLPISKKLAEMMNGHITVNSQVGRGSIFSVTLAGVQAEGETSAGLSVSDETSGCPRFQNLCDASELTTPEAPPAHTASASLHKQLTAREKKRLRGLAMILTEQIMPQWKEIGETLIFDEVEELAVKADEQAREYEYAPLIEWAAVMRRCVQKYDIEALPKTYRQLPVILGELEKML